MGDDVRQTAYDAIVSAIDTFETLNYETAEGFRKETYSQEMIRGLHIALELFKVRKIVVHCSRWSKTFFDYDAASISLEVGQIMLASELCEILGCASPFPTDREIEIIEIS